VEVDVQIQRTSEALDDGDRTALTVTDPSARCPSPQPAEHDPDEDRQHVAAEGGVEGELVPQGPREREDPLTHRDVGDHPVDQMCGQFRHAAAATRGAEPAFATERHHHLVPALLAPHVQAAPREKTASQVRLELLLHERWQSAPSIAGLDLRQKLAEVLLDHPIGT
jgi:hypothetical protein